MTRGDPIACAYVPVPIACFTILIPISISAIKLEKPFVILNRLVTRCLPIKNNVRPRVITSSFRQRNRPMPRHFSFDGFAPFVISIGIAPSPQDQRACLSAALGAPQNGECTSAPLLCLSVFFFVRFASDGCAPLPSLLSYTRGIEEKGLKERAVGSIIEIMEMLCRRASLAVSSFARDSTGTKALNESSELSRCYLKNEETATEQERVK